jgi:ribosomal protein S18 acetylase RimI-like enzyme
MIRKYEEKDRKAVEQCIFELQEEEFARQPDYWQTPEKTLENKYLDYLIKWAADSNGKLLIAEVDGNVAGYLAVIIEDDKDPSPAQQLTKKAYIPDFDVLRAYQKQGIGKKLVAVAEEYAKAHNCEYLSLDVTTGNPAIDFYKKSGFQEYSTHLKKKL